MDNIGQGGRMGDNMNSDRLITNMIDQIKEAQLKLGYVKETVRLYYPLSSLYAILGEESSLRPEEGNQYLEEGNLHPEKNSLYQEESSQYQKESSQYQKESSQRQKESSQYQKESSQHQKESSLYPEEGSLHPKESSSSQEERGLWMLRTLEEAFSEDCVLGKLSFSLHGDRVEIGIPPQGVEYVHVHVEEPAFLAALIRLFETNHHCSIEDIRQVFEIFSQDYVCRHLTEELAESMGFDYVLYFKDTSIDAYYYCVKEEMGHTIYHRFTEEDYRLLQAGG